MSTSKGAQSADANLRTISGLEPESVWRQFAGIASVPRCSQHEEKIRDYVARFAEERKLEWQADAAGNMIVRKPGSKGREKRPTVVVQGHLDMVCEKNEGTEHDFSRDPIRLVVDGDWLRASGTTLGADNGLAVAMALALLDDPGIEHPPLEALFTVDEEGGLVGATKLDGSIVSGKTILNLDSEEEGTFYIGCAGGCNTEGWVPMQQEPGLAGIPSSVALTVSVTGLRGGHSGAEIHEGRGNAIRLGARFLWNAARKFELRVFRAEGGGMHNAIPRELFAGVVVGQGDVQAFEQMAAEYQTLFRAELADIEPGLTLAVRRADEQPVRHLTEESSDRLLSVLYSLPHGVDSMSREIAALVASSTNLAAIHLSEHEAHILTSQRGSLDSMTQDLSDRVGAIVEHAGGRIKTFGIYPGWPPEPDSQLVKLCSRTYSKLNGKEPEIKAIHAGLECGVLGQKVPGSSLISFGPDIRGAHTPDERVHVQSTDRMWRFLLEVLKEL
ncbi:MAG TPA: aminoacyl-histidine dipeptidase [Spirochaetia bacterium]|nr:aminoacyl-histidine dipeptidase [Spirochaetia bacterium]